MQAAAEDRRMLKAHLKLQMGGVAAAAEAYRGVADAQRHRHRIARAAAKTCSPASISFPTSATPARGSS